MVSWSSTLWLKVFIPLLSICLLHSWHLQPSLCHSFLSLLSCKPYSPDFFVFSFFPKVLSHTFPKFLYYFLLFCTFFFPFLFSFLFSYFLFFFFRFCFTHCFKVCCGFSSLTPTTVRRILGLWPLPPPLWMLSSILVSLQKSLFEVRWENSTSIREQLICNV